MKGIQMTGDDGRPVGLLLGRLQDRDLVNQDQLEHLRPVILYLIEQAPEVALPDAEARLQISLFGEDRAVLKIEGGEEEAVIAQVQSIQEICERNLTERLIVPQYMGIGPTINHRVMQFEASGRDLKVKFSELGKFNDFEVAMADIHGMYPSLERV